MSRKLDKELEDALSAGEAEGELEADSDRSSTPGVETAPPPARKSNTSVGLLVALVAMAGGLAALLLVGFNDAAVYAVDVQKVQAEGEALVGRHLRVEGELVPGTLTKRDQPCEYRFVIHTEDAQLPVRYSKCVVPDTFRDRPEGGVQVTVEGKLTSPGDFEATLVMAKCASKYDPETHELKLDATAAGEPKVEDETIR